MQLTVEVPEQQVSFFKELFRQLNIPVVDEIEADDEPTAAADRPEQLKDELRQAVRELKLAKKGELKLNTLAEFLDEL